MMAIPVTTRAVSCWRRCIRARTTIIIHGNNNHFIKQYHFNPMQSSSSSSSSRPTTPTPQQLGFEFEKQVVQTLNSKYSFNIKNTSKQSHDQGIDFYGTLTVSQLQNLSIPVLGQCKREWKPIGVHYIRELQGTLSQFNNQSFSTLLTGEEEEEELETRTMIQSSDNNNNNNNNSKYIGLLISDSGYTTFATRLAQQCSDGIILCTLDGDSLIHFIMNSAARKRIGSQFITAFQRSPHKSIVFYEQGPNGEMIPLISNQVQENNSSSNSSNNETT